MHIDIDGVASARSSTIAATPSPVIRLLTVGPFAAIIAAAGDDAT